VLQLRSNGMHSIISRGRRDGWRVVWVWEQVGHSCEDNEPRPPAATGVLVFGVGPPKGRLQYRVEQASHDRTAVVQRLAGSRWLANRSYCYSFSVATKAAEYPSTCVSRVSAASATAPRHALVKFVCKSAVCTTETISKRLMDGETTQTANVRIGTANQGRK